MAKTGRKGYGEELELIRRYSDLSELHFRRLKERLESDDKSDQNFALQLLNGAFVKMIPQKLDGEFNNRNINSNVECTPEEHNQVKQALIASVQNTGSPE